MDAARLTDRERQALWWRITGRSAADLARGSQVPDGAVRKSLARAVRKIRAAAPDFRFDA
jgi:DNA-directed RNA polymerase specialized sigma24 family protein